MRSILKKLLEERKKYSRDNRGLSLVEVLCAVAIFSLIAATIGTIIVVSARTYRNGVTETTVQQEAQLAANNIGNIVKDACSVMYGESGLKFIKDGIDDVTEVDGTLKMQGSDATELYIITNKKMQYCIKYDIPNKALVYTELDISDPAAPVSTGAQVLARNVSDFTADTTDFKDSRTIKLKMTVTDESTGRNIPMEYTMTSRNEVAEEMEFVSSEIPVIIFLDSNPTLVPGETYQLPISVVGKLPKALEGTITGGLSLGSLTTDYVEVSVPRDTTVDSGTVTVMSNDLSGNLLAQASSNINVRRVASINVNHAVDRSQVVDGTYEGAKAKYTFYANVSGSHLQKSPGSAWDSGYKKAQAVYWSYKLTVDGNTYTYEKTPSGESYSNKSGAEAYVKILSFKDDIDKPCITFEIMQTMPADFLLEVTATSRHALGENKYNSRYPDDTTTITGTDSIKPRATKIDSAFEITLEPNQSDFVKLNMMGGLTSDVTFVYNDRSDATTKAEYDVATDKVKITLGIDEIGNGKNPVEGEKYTFTIDVYVAGEKKATITVHVRRIENISIEVIDNAHDASGNLMDNPTYDFRTRINVDNNKNDDNMQNAVKYLILDKSGEPDKLSPTVSKTLSSRISWELKNTKSGEVLKKDSVICMAGTSASDKGQVIGEYTKEFKVNSTLYYKIVNVKPARVEQDTSGNWYLKQVPEVDIKLGNGDDLPANTELTVKVEMLHPLGGEYNETGIAYGIAEAEISRQGKQSVIVPELIVAEPGQGTNDPAQSDYELAIPIEVSGGDVYQMTATISGNSSKDTKLSAYETADKNGNKNPYKAENAGSGSNSIWYLGLLIGTDEKGKDNSGLMDLTVTAYDQQGETVAKVESKIAIRRVTKVKIDGTATTAATIDSAIIVQDDKGNRYLNYEYNKVGNTITLEAYATGYGANGTEYFGIQKDENGNVLRWEKDGHGKYQTPYSMKWSIYDKKGKALNLSDYFESVPTLVDIPENGVTKSTITFTLKKALPKGTTIKATSLHALGKSDSTKTNKSGKEYDNVYAILKIDIIDPDDPVVDDDIDFLDDLLRGQRYLFYDHQKRWPNWDSQRQNFEKEASKTGVNYDNAKWFWRFREITNVIIHEDGTSEPVYGPWTRYTWMSEHSRNNKAIDGPETWALHPDKRYQIQIALIAVDKNTQTIYWPYDDAIRAAGTGFENYHKGWSSTTTTPVEEYSDIFNLGRGCISFKLDGANVDTYGKATLTENGEQTYKSYGTLENPVILHNGENLTVNLYADSLKISHHYQWMKGRVQKLSNNTWVEVDQRTICINRDIQFKDNLIITDVKDTNKGIYRISYREYDAEWADIDFSNIWDPIYNRLRYTDYLLCGSNGTAGYVYFEIK